MKRIILITGRPGIGKTTLIKKIINDFKDKHVLVGFYTEEVRQHGVRVGFRIINLEGASDWLAHIEYFRGGPRIGKYWVNIDAIKRVGISTLINNLSKAELIIIDEIGPMELLHPDFLNTINMVVNSEKPIIATIHEKYSRYRELSSLVHRDDTELIVLTLSNRDSIYVKVKDLIKNLLLASGT